MTEKQYVNAVIGKLTCGRSRKKEFQRQLLADIELRKETGEELGEIFSQMGTAGEVAAAFNETVPPEEKKQYARNRGITIVACVAAFILLIAAAIYWMLPKTLPIEKSRYFDKEQVEAAMKMTVEWFDAGESKTLQENAIPEMQEYLTEEKLKEIKETVAGDWGERKSLGAIYLTELAQENVRYAVGEITVTYEHVSVTYRLTYDRELKLAGLYVR